MQGPWRWHDSGWRPLIWLGLITFGIAFTPFIKLLGESGNWRASFLFVASVILVRIVYYFSIPQPIIAMTVVYSITAALGAFYVDRFAGIFLALISLIIATEILGFLPQLHRQSVGEIVWVAGVVCCGFIGPSGGIYGPQSFGTSPRNASGLPDTVASMATGSGDLELHRENVGQDQA